MTADPDAPVPEALEGPEGPPPEEAPEPEGPALAIFAHPDDAEICAGGTLAKWASQGREVHLLVLTNGDRGSDTLGEDRLALAATRLQETAAGAEVMGLTGCRVLDNHDGELENTYAVRVEVAREIRRVKPRAVLTCDPTSWFFGNMYFNHSDHRTAGAVALDGTFPGAGNPLFFEELLDEGLEPWKVAEIWIGWTNEPNHYEDVTGFMQTKIGALAAHASQLKDNMLGFFEQWLPTEAAENGRKIGAEHAEAFRVLNLS